MEAGDDEIEDPADDRRPARTCRRSGASDRSSRCVVAGARRCRRCDDASEASCWPGGRSTRMGQRQGPDRLARRTPRRPRARRGGARQRTDPSSSSRPPTRTLPLDVVRDPEPRTRPAARARRWASKQSAPPRAFVCGTDQPFAHSLITELLRAREADVVAYRGPTPRGDLQRRRWPRSRRDAWSRTEACGGCCSAVDTHWLPGDPKPCAASTGRQILSRTSVLTREGSTANPIVQRVRLRSISEPPD